MFWYIAFLMLCISEYMVGVNMRLTKPIRDEYVKLLESKGQGEFLKFVLKASFDAQISPHAILLEQSDQFFSLFRSSGLDKYFTIGILLRRAAHFIYRKYLKKYPKGPKDKRFLQAL